MKHQKIFHQHPYQCASALWKQNLTTSLSSFLNIRLQNVLKKLHECIFCHMILPQGEVTYQDKFNNLTHHESECGSKTTECFECGKVLKTRDMTSHMKMHYMDKKEKSTLVVKHCSNTVCVSILKTDLMHPTSLGSATHVIDHYTLPVHDPTGQ